LNIKINKSYWLTNGLILIHAGAVLLLWILPWPVTAIAAGMALVVAHGAWTVWRFLGAPQRLVLRDDGTIALETRYGRSDARVTAARHLPGAIQLIFKPANGRTQTLWLMQDAIAANDFHELCARIRQQRLPVREPVS
jgi:hypothetical protein